MARIVWALWACLLAWTEAGGAAENVPVANGDFSQALRGSWEIFGGEGAGQWTAATGHTAAGAVQLIASEQPCGVQQTKLIPVRAGEAFKLLIWVRAEGKFKGIYPELELLAAGRKVESASKPRSISGTTPGWVPLWHIVDVPADPKVTQMRITLQCAGGSGNVWFDDVRLRRLPPDRPTQDGPVGPPPFGVITARDGQLFGDGGRRIRFWGVNCVDELGRSYREIDQIIQRIKAMGFNALRLHLYDVRLVDPEAKTARGEPTSRVWRTAQRIGDGSLLDRFDYFIYRAEKAGLYLYLTLDRARVPFARGDYDILPAAGEEDESAWKEAVAATNKGWANEHVTHVDERLAALHEEYARRLLDHRNAYTGVRIGDDPYVALWELTNENGFPGAMLTGTFHSWPVYFQRALQRRWNRWLQERYGTQERLIKAWGALREGESLAEGSIVPAPTTEEAKEYPQPRLADFRRFVYELALHHARRLEKAIRNGGKVAARVPITYDTIYEHKHIWYYPMSHGSFQAVGTYISGSVRLERDKSWLGSPPLAMYNYSWATVADKPIVVYENNIIKPAADRAYFPLLVATFAAARDWDGVFWYVWSDGTVWDQVDNDVYSHIGLRYAARSHLWHGIVIATDEVLLASLRLAGEIFTRFAVPPAENPVLLTVGAEDLFERNNIWIGDVNVPFPAEAPGPYPRAHAMGATDFVYTMRCRYAPEQPHSSVSRPLLARTPELCSPVPGLTYDFRRGVIVVNRPQAKAVVGFAEGGWDYGGGLRVQLKGSPFFCQGLVSLDNQALEKAQHALLVCATSGENRGIILREDAAELVDRVAGWGWGPPDILRPAVQFSLPGVFAVKAVDFTLTPFYKKRTKVVELPAGHQLFWAELSR